MKEENVRYRRSPSRIICRMIFRKKFDASSLQAPRNASTQDVCAGGGGGEKVKGEVFIDDINNVVNIKACHLGIVLARDNI